MKGILMSAPMVRAILDGRKTQTRRFINPQPWAFNDVEAPVQDTTGQWGQWYHHAVTDTEAALEWRPMRQPFMPDDRVYVRESWRTESNNFDARAPGNMSGTERVLYNADADYSGNGTVGRTRASMHMPEWASRIKLCITEVRAERLQDITDEDVDAEFLGEDYPQSVLPELFPPSSDFAQYEDMTLQQIYARLWDYLAAGKPGRTWADNPWVWVITFEVQQ